MLTRRDLLQSATALGSSALFTGSIPEVIARALAIDPAEGSTFLDAEHIVVLMQENRSFDHAYGSLSGVRGFRDPRIHLQPNRVPVWFQAHPDGTIVPPFRMDIEESNVTWIGGTPHSWRDQVDARNDGRYDKWLVAKKRGDGYPMTMGFFTREDIPFYYALADAFTVCDQAFCSSLTGTTPNRLYLWTGTIREDAQHRARVSNGDCDYEDEASWTTYPERLEEAGVSWKIYQNEISLDSGLVGEYDAWLSNFTDNPIEWFSQYNVRFSKTHRAHLQTSIEKLPGMIAASEKKLEGPLEPADKEKETKRLDQMKAQLESAKTELSRYNEETWNVLPAKSKALHQKAFSTNENDPKYRALVEHEYKDGEETRKTYVPAGDVLHQFRADVDSGSLPAISWIVAPERFSDHPGSAWFGAWYLSEVMSILTKDPEVWKKTIFVLCYDENDGFFDHVPPFVAPHPGRPETGKCSEGIDTAVDVSNAYDRDSSIGLGYRCPMLIASPWTRGGYVNSEVCDHTSVLRLMETWLAGKGTPVKEENLSEWRRTVCGDLTSAFRPYSGEKFELPKPLGRNAFIERIHKASFKSRPVAAGTLQASEASAFDVGAFQEHGSRPSNALPYRLEASIEPLGSEVRIRLEANRVGSPFNVYSYGETMLSRAYAVRAGDALEDRLPLDSKGLIRIDGPNGFFRELETSGPAPFFARARQKGEDLELELENQSTAALEIEIRDRSYGASLQKVSLGIGVSKRVVVSTRPGKRWYDLEVVQSGTAYRFAGRLETGEDGVSDPAMD